MNLWEISFRAQYDYPFIDISRRHPDTALSLWCIWKGELLRVPTRKRSVLDDVKEQLEDGGWVIEQWADNTGGRTFFLKDTCERWNSVWNIVEPHNVMVVPPAVFSEGWCHARVLSFDEKTTRSMFRSLQEAGKAELISKRDLPYDFLPSSVWVNSLFGDLTGKQQEALLSAHRYGYYRSPRKVGTEDVSKASGVSRSTFEEHLRKAENRVMDALIPYLQLYAKSMAREEHAPVAGTLDGAVATDV